MTKKSLLRLYKRADFVGVRDGKRYYSTLFLLKEKRRLSEFTAVAREDIRVGFTVTRSNGNAVIRNRIKRRLKAAIDQLSLDVFSPATDYVFIAYTGILQVSFSCLVQEIILALEQKTRKKSFNDGF